MSNDTQLRTGTGMRFPKLDREVLKHTAAET